MSKILIIMCKEMIDNLRDRRSVFFALIYGSILMPALIFGPLIYNANKHFSQNYETPVSIHVRGEERAPNLIKRLHERNVDVETAPEGFRQKLMDEDIELVLEVSRTYGDKFVKGSPARVTLHYNREHSESQQLFWRIRGELEGYNQTLAAQRMLIRGFDQEVLRPLNIVENEVSEEDAGAGMLANMIMFLVVLSMTMGGFYLAIDVTAGERERLSLEPLLSLAVTRFQVAMGKYLAILVFVFIALLLPMISIAIGVMFIPEEFYGNADTPGVVTFLKILLLNLPLCVLLTGFLMAIAAYSKSVKEAQTQLGVAMLLPMTPFFIVQFMNISPGPETQATPILGQYLLTNQIMLDSAFPISAMVPGALTTLGAAALLFYGAVHLYRQDAILG